MTKLFFLDSHGQATQTGTSIAFPGDIGSDMDSSLQRMLEAIDAGKAKDA